MNDICVSLAVVVAIMASVVASETAPITEFAIHLEDGRPVWSRGGEVRVWSINTLGNRPVDKTEYKEPPDLHKDLSTFWKILPAGVGSRATIQVGTGKWKGYYLTHDDKGDDRTSHDVFLSKTQLPASIWTVSYGTLTKKDTISQGRWYLNVEKTSDEKYYSEKGVRETITFHRLRVTREKGPRFEIEEDSK